MIKAYDRLYLSNAQRTLGRMYDLSINGIGMDPDLVSELFVRSGTAKMYGYGHPGFVAGMSGKNLLEHILDRSGYPEKAYSELQNDDTSPEFWAGWILCYYQWYSSRPFEFILEKIPISRIVKMYHPFHEMSPTQFVSAAEKIIQESAGETNLKKRRMFCKLSQSELAERSGVSLRMIQLYEQRRSNIGKAQYSTLARLASVLRCPVEALVDDPLYAGEVDLEYHV